MNGESAHDALPATEHPRASSANVRLPNATKGYPQPMAELVLCVECNRHVRDATCPFCGATLESSRSSALARASRAAIFAIAAAPGLAACHRETVEMYGGPPAPMLPDAAASAAPSASASASATAQTPVAPTAETAHVTAYGGPPTATVTPTVVPSPQRKP